MKHNAKEAYCHSFGPTLPKTIIAKFNLDFKFIYRYEEKNNSRSTRQVDQPKEYIGSSACLGEESL
jgi:hypothetical protein